MGAHNNVADEETCNSRVEGKIETHMMAGKDRKRMHLGEASTS